MRRVLIAALAALSLFAAVDLSSAADNKPKDTKSVINQLRIRQMTKQFELTPEQQKRCETILAEEAKEMDAIQADTTVPRQERVEKGNVVKANYKTKLREVLTDEQRAKWDAHETKLAEAAAKRKKAFEAKPTPEKKAVN